MIGYVGDMTNKQIGCLAVDGVVLEGTAVLHTREGIMAFLNDRKEAVAAIVECHLSDLPDDLQNLSLGCLIDRIGELLECKDVMITRTDEGSLKVAAQFSAQLSKWNLPWAYEEYAYQLGVSMGDTGIQAELYMEPDHYGSFTAFLATSNRSRIRDSIDELHAVMLTLHQHAVTALVEKVGTRSVAMSFDFPDAVKTSCEQYLLYFVQFLRDVGVEATAELREHAGRVLFSVTPKDESEALDKIREALEVYLRLPSAVGVNAAASMSTDLATQQLLANIYHLKSQLMLQAE